MKSKIKDRFITESGLPNQPIGCRIKYDEGGSFDKIRISYEDSEDGLQEIQFKNFLKVVYIALPAYKKDLRIIDIPRADLLLDGYIGFVYKYTKIPSINRDISFICLPLFYLVLQ